MSQNTFTWWVTNPYFHIKTGSPVKLVNYNINFKYYMIINMKNIIIIFIFLLLLLLILIIFQKSFVNYYFNNTFDNIYKKKIWGKGNINGGSSGTGSEPNSNKKYI